MRFSKEVVVGTKPFVIAYNTNAVGWFLIASEELPRRNAFVLRQILDDAAAASIEKDDKVERSTQGKHSASAENAFGAQATRVASRGPHPS